MNNNVHSFCRFITWGLISIVTAPFFLCILPNRPSMASWLTDDECQELESEINREPIHHNSERTLLKDVCQIEVPLLSLARFFGTAISVGFEFFLPTMLNDWYQPTLHTLTRLLMIMALITMPFILFMGWSSDRFQTRYAHSIVLASVVSLFFALLTVGTPPLGTTLIYATIISMATKAYQPSIVFLGTSLSMEGLFSKQSIGLFGLAGKLGNGFGPLLIGMLKSRTNLFSPSLICLAVFALASAFFVLIVFLRLRKSESAPLSSHKN